MSTFTPQSQHAATFTGSVKGGIPNKVYNQSGFKYNQALDPISNKPVYYNSIGTVDVFTSQSQHAATFTGQTQH